MLEFAVLGLLSEAPMHGYELRQRLKAVLGAFRAFSYGSLYPTLRRMRERGWIAEEAPDPAATAPAHPGRRGKGTPVATKLEPFMICSMAAFWPSKPKIWMSCVRLASAIAFCAPRHAEVGRRILEGRRRRVEERRDGLRAGLARTRAKLDRYTLQLQEHGLDAVEREVRWLTELIDTELREQHGNPPAEK